MMATKKTSNTKTMYIAIGQDREDGDWWSGDMWSTKDAALDDLYETGLCSNVDASDYVPNTISIISIIIPNVVQQINIQPKIIGTVTVKV